MVISVTLPLNSSILSDEDVMIKTQWFYVGNVDHHKSSRQKGVIPYEEFMIADSIITQGLEGVVLHSTHLFVDPLGNTEDIYLPIVISGGEMGHFFNFVSHTNLIEPHQKEILENVFNSCGGFIDTDTTSSIPDYVSWVSTLLNDCGVSVHILELEKAITIQSFPNPCKDSFFVSSPIKIQKLSIFNFVGYQIYKNDNVNDYSLQIMVLTEMPQILTIIAETVCGQISVSKQIIN
jgi:hypothetical protein